jgi:hypothetical protein
MHKRRFRPLVGAFAEMLLLCAIYFFDKRDEGTQKKIDAVVLEAQMMVFFLVVFIYILARLFLIVELFRCLFFLPPSAFVATWVSSVPHVS